MKKLLIIAILLLPNLNIFAQNTDAAFDSLFRVLNKTEIDTIKVNTLNKISRLYMKSDFEKAFVFADSSLKMAQEISYKKGIALSYTHKSYALIRLGKTDDALENIYKSLAIYEILEDYQSVAKNLATIAQIYYVKQEFQKAIDFTQQSIDVKQKKNINEGLEINFMTLGAIYTEQGSYTKALEMFFKSLEYCEINKNDKSIAGNYNNIAIVYRKLNDDESAVEFYNKSLEIYEEIQDRHGVLKILNNLAVVYEKNKNIIKAKEYYIRALDLSRELNYPKGIAMTLTNLGGINISERNFLQAKKNFAEANNLYKEMSDNFGLANVNLLIGQLDYELGNYTTAIKHTEYAYKLTGEIGVLKLESDAALQLSLIFEDMLDYKNSLKYFKIFHEMNDSIFNIENSQIREEMKNKFSSESKEKELEIKNKEIEILENQKQINSIRNSLYITGLALLFSLTILLIIFFRNKIYRNKQLEERNRVIAESEKKMLKLEIEAKENKALQLKDEIEYKNRELQNFAHNIIDKNDFILKIQNDLKKLKKNITEKNAENYLQSVLTDINKKVLVEREREEFLAHVDQIYSNFYYKFKERFPDISESEQRLASLLKIGLSSKDIASILHITPKSVDTNRYRLRKKINLDQDVNLNAFLKDF